MGVRIATKVGPGTRTRRTSWMARKDRARVAACVVEVGKRDQSEEGDCERADSASPE